MQFWSGTPFLDTTDALALVRMLDEAGYYGVITADHLIYPAATELSRTPTVRTSRRGRPRPHGPTPG